MEVAQESFIGLIYTQVHAALNQVRIYVKTPHESTLFKNTA